MPQAKLSSQEVIQMAIDAGAKIISEKKEESGTCEAKTVILKNGDCHIKVGFMKLGDKIIDTPTTCCCNKYGLFEPLIEDCFKDYVPKP